MRSTVLRTVLVGATAVTAVFPAMSQAAAPAAGFSTVTITDPTGDANGLNGEGFASAPSVSTPADDAAGDIVSISWTTNGTVKTVGKKTVRSATGLQVTMKLSAKPQTNTIYRVTTATADCTTFWLTYSTAADGPAVAAFQDNCPGFTAAGPTSTSEVIPLTTFKIDGTSITWTVPASVLPKSVKLGTQITSLSGHTRLFAGSATLGKGATVPEIDEAAGAGTFTYGK